MSLDEKKAAACLTLYIFVLSQTIFAIMVKILTRGSNAGKKKSNLKKQKGTTNTKQEQRKQETKQTYFASKCLGWHPGTCQVQVVRNDKMVIDL